MFTTGNCEQRWCTGQKIVTNFKRKGRAGKHEEHRQIIWIFFGVHTANVVRIAKRLAREKVGTSWSVHLPFMRQ